MSASPVNPLRRRARFGLSLALGGALVLSCGGNPTGAPGQGAANLPPQTNPGVKDADKDKTASEGVRRTLKGTVVDALTGEPISKAVLYVEGVVTTIESTPTPPTPSPGADDKPAGAAGDAGVGMGGETVRIAQASDGDEDLPPDDGPDAGNEPPDAFSSPIPLQSDSPLPGASFSPGSPTARPSGGRALPGAKGSPEAPNGTSTGPGAPGGTPAGAPGGNPAVAATPFPLTPVKPDSNGKFEVKDLPEGSYSLTFWAPGYQAQTFQGNLPAELAIELRPLEAPREGLHELKGVARQASNQPASGAEIEVSSLPGKFPGFHTSSDDSGSFTMPGLVSGNYAIAGWTTNLDGELTTFALVKEVPVSLGREKRTVSPTLVLRAVTTPLLLAGTVEGTVKEADAKAAKAAKKPVDGVRPQSIRAFIQVGEGEIPVATTTIGKDGYFRLRLPPLPEGASYHLAASGTSESGQTVYLHKYDITTSDPKVSLQLPSAPAAVAVTDRSRGPAFSWDSAGTDVSAYRLALETVGPDGDTIWEGWTRGNAIRLPGAKDFTLLKEGESYRYSLTAIRLTDKKAELEEMAIAPWASSGITRPATFEVQRLKPGQKPTAEGPAKPLRVPVATPAAAGRPSALPLRPAAPKPLTSAKPSPKPSGRIKPLTDL